MGAIDMVAAEALVIAETEQTADALYNIGLLYSTGQGVALDLVQAHKWFNLAAMRGNRTALGSRAELAKEMTAHEIAAAQRQAREWLTSH